MTTPDSGTGETSTAGEAYLSIERLTKRFEGLAAVDNVSLTVRQGEIFALLGPSGCGKSTLLRCLAGFEMATSGEMVLDGEPIGQSEPYDRPVNMMFQSYALFPHMSVEQNIAFGLRQDRVPRQEIRDRVDDMLSLVQLGDLRRRKPHQLSGGQQQRVALARSLVKRPKLLLLDEPMGALDKKLRTRMQLEVVTIIERLGVTCMMVTHDQEEAMTMAHRLAIMEGGRIMQIGTPDEIYEQPNSRYTAEFIGSVNIFEGTLREDEPDYVIIDSPECPCDLYVGHGITGHQGMPVALALRPEKIFITRENPGQPHNQVEGTVEEIAYLGSHSVYHVRLASGRLLMATALNNARWGTERITWDDRVWVHWDGAAGVVLTA
ncbi:MAG: polyamine ABC transporter ATP-binding protein [Pseudomonadales bacterium]|jgi:putrescine transport system ATP-binding protein